MEGVVDRQAIRLCKQIKTACNDAKLISYAISELNRLSLSQFVNRVGSPRVYSQSGDQVFGGYESRSNPANGRKPGFDRMRCRSLFLSQPSQRSPIATVVAFT